MATKKLYRVLPEKINRVRSNQRQKVSEKSPSKFFVAVKSTYLNPPHNRHEGRVKGLEIFIDPQIVDSQDGEARILKSREVLTGSCHAVRKAGRGKKRRSVRRVSRNHNFSRNSLHYTSSVQYRWITVRELNELRKGLSKLTTKNVEELAVL